MKKKYSRFTMCLIYKDTGETFKESFELKQLALDWFESFKQTNNRPVTVIFYCGVVPYWVYYAEK